MKIRDCIILVVTGMVVHCIHDLQNPSDPESDDYTEFSKAYVTILGNQSVKAGDTVGFDGGVTSSSVADDKLVTRYAWDFDGDGTVDTVTRTPDTIEYVYERTGWYRCVLTCTDRAHFTDTASIVVRVRPPSWGLVITLIFRFDTLHITIDSEDPITEVTAPGDTIVIIPQTRNGGIAIVQGPGDTVDVPLVDADTVALTSFDIDTIASPDINVYIPDFPTVDGFPDSIGGECAFFAADSALMHTNLQVYDIMWEQTKADEFGTLFFGVVADSIGTFTSEPYGYDFEYVPLGVTLGGYMALFE